MQGTLLNKITFKNYFFALLFLLFAMHNYILAQENNVVMLKSYIEKEYKKIYPELMIDNISLVARNSLNLYDIKILSKNIVSTKSANGYLTIAYKQDNKVLQESIRYIISATIRLYMTTEHIKTGSNFTASSFTDNIRDFSTIALVPASKYEILQSSAKMYIPINTIIYRNKLAKKTLITKDSAVKIIFLSDGIEAISLGKALENGVSGDIIKVENVESKRVISGEVIKEGVVRIK